MSFTKTREVRTIEEASKPDLYVNPCQVCRKVTQTTTLMERGGMCQGCFGAYCDGAKQNRIGLRANQR